MKIVDQRPERYGTNFTVKVKLTPLLFYELRSRLKN